jgi:hypothetical protein
MNPTKETKQARDPGLESGVAMKVTPPEAKAIRAAAEDMGPSIAVAILRFRNGESVDIPGKQGAAAITATVNPQPGHQSHSIRFYPKAGFFEITHQASGGGKVTTLYVDRAGTSWEPA